MNSLLEYLREILFVLGSRKKKIPFMVSAFILLSILDIIGLGLIAPFITTVLFPEELAGNYFYNFFVSSGIFTEGDNFIIFMSLALLGIFTGKAVVGIFINWMILTFCFNQAITLRTYLMDSYLNLPYKVYLNRNSSEYIYNIEQLANQYSQTILQSLLRITSEAIIVLAIVIFLGFFDFFAFKRHRSSFTGTPPEPPTFIK